MNHTKGISTNLDIKICNVVIFLKQDLILSNSYQYSIVNKIVPSKDGVIRKGIVWYKNNQENVDRYAIRAVRDLVLTHPIDKLNLIEELRKVASVANQEYEAMNV